MTPWELIPIIMTAVQNAIKNIAEAKASDGKLEAHEVVQIIWSFAWDIIKNLTQAGTK